MRGRNESRSACELTRWMADGSLVFTDFGWDVLARLRDAGFAHAAVDCFLAPHYGHVGDGQLVFRATKDPIQR